MQESARPMAARLRRALVVALVSLGVVFGVGVSAAQAEPFHGSYMTTSWAPWDTTWSSGFQTTIPAGASVNMSCWNTGAYRNGTAKWFRVTANRYPYSNGYVPATTVGNQWTTSPHC